jgi:hypothetical protein
MAGTAAGIARTRLVLTADTEGAVAMPDINKNNAAAKGTACT